MPALATKYFGQQTYQHDNTFEFPAGLPGFEDEREFVLLEQPASKPLVFVQSVAHDNVCFVALPARLVDSGYRVKLTPEDWKLLGGSDIPDELLLLVFLAFHESGPPTANLLAPLVIHPQRRRGIQVVQGDSDYSYRHPLFALGAPC